MQAPAGYSYVELARRIGAVLQVPAPSLSTLRAAAAEARRTPGAKRRVRLTFGMPAPKRVGGRALFDRAAVEAWLAGHPWLSDRAAADQLRESVAAGNDLRAAVEQARQANLSWRAIADTLTAAGTPRSAQALHKAFRTEPSPSSGRQRDKNRTGVASTNPGRG